MEQCTDTAGTAGTSGTTDIMSLISGYDAFAEAGELSVPAASEAPGTTQWCVSLQETLGTIHEGC